jgi:hypothetical protein
VTINDKENKKYVTKIRSKTGDCRVTKTITISRIRRRERRIKKIQQNGAAGKQQSQERIVTILSVGHWCN